MFNTIFQKALPSSADSYAIFTEIGQACGQYNTKYGDECELEARLGVLGANGRFDNSVNEVQFNRYLELVTRSTGWAPLEACEYEDAYYTVDGKTVRTRARPTPTGSLEIQSVVKSNKLNWTFACEITPTTPDKSSLLRISLAREHKVMPSDVPTETTRFLITKEKSFLYTPIEYKKPMLRLDARASYVGKSRSIAEQNQIKNIANYTIEIEMIDSLFLSHRFGEAYAALSIAVKIIDFIRFEAQDSPSLSPFSVQLRPL
jgi:hypothetical protein